MPSKSALLLLAIVLLVATEVSSHDEELKIKVNYAKPPASPVPAPPPVVTVSPPPPPVKAPTPATPAQPPVAPSPPAPIVRSKKDCIPLCEYRCQLHSRKRVCMRACMTCCDRCKCVPPGTYGNREICGKCYTDMLTHGDRSKCP